MHIQVESDALTQLYTFTSHFVKTKSNLPYASTTKKIYIASQEKSTSFIKGPILKTKRNVAIGHRCLHFSTVVTKLKIFRQTDALTTLPGCSFDLLLIFFNTTIKI